MYQKPELWVIGAVGNVVLGETPPPPDNEVSSLDQGPPEGIVMGLDD